MPKRDFELVRTEAEMRDLLIDLRIRFSWLFFTINQEEDLQEAMEGFERLCRQDPSTLTHSIASFGTEKS